MIDKYSIRDAVADGAVVPLIYEGRAVDVDLSDAALDAWFDHLHLTPEEWAVLLQPEVYEPLSRWSDALRARDWQHQDELEEGLQGCCSRGRDAKDAAAHDVDLAR